MKRLFFFVVTILLIIGATMPMYFKDRLYQSCFVLGAALTLVVCFINEANRARISKEIAESKNRYDKKMLAKDKDEYLIDFGSIAYYVCIAASFLGIYSWLSEGNGFVTFFSNAFALFIGHVLGYFIFRMRPVEMNKEAVAAAN